MACFFCNCFEPNKNNDDSVAGRCKKFHTYIEERIAHEDCSFCSGADSTKYYKDKEENSK